MSVNALEDEAVVSGGIKRHKISIVDVSVSILLDEFDSLILRLELLCNGDQILQ